LLEEQPLGGLSLPCLPPCVDALLQLEPFRLFGEGWEREVQHGHLTSFGFASWRRSASLPLKPV
jgi:hypothetical protein